MEIADTPPSSRRQVESNFRALSQSSNDAIGSPRTPSNLSFSPPSEAEVTSSQRCRPLRALSRARPTKYTRQDSGNFRINPNLRSLISQAQKTLNLIKEEKVSVFSVKTNKDQVNHAFLNKLKELHDRGEIYLQQQSVVLYATMNEGEESLEVLDGNHRIIVLQDWFVRTFGPDSSKNCNQHFISAQVVRTSCEPGMRCFIAWKAHVGTSCNIQARRSIKKNVDDLLKLRLILFPYMQKNVFLSRAYSTNLKSRIKLETGMEIPEHHVYIAFRQEEERGRLIELASQLAKQMEYKEALHNEDERNVVKSGHPEKTTFWRRFIEIYDDKLYDCRTEMNEILAEGQTGLLNTTDILTRLRRKPSKLSVFLYKYYSHLPTSCYLFKPKAFGFNECLDFIDSCTKTFGLEEMRKRNEVPSVLRMLKIARLYFGNQGETDPLVTILLDLQVSDWKEQVLANDVQFVFLDLESFKDCADTVMFEIKKMATTLKSVLFLYQHEDFDVPELHNPKWTELKEFLKKWKYDAKWDVLHPDVGFGAAERQSYLLHYKKEETLKLYGRDDKFVSLDQIASMFPVNFCGVYFVGHRDCRRIGRHSVPKRENNIIVYRFLEDLIVAQKVTCQVSGTQFWTITGTYSDDVNGETSDSVDI